MNPPTTILVIDDDELMRMGTASVLTESGYNVLEAEDGKQGVEMARQAMPDLIVCDLNMPVLNGYAVLEKLRKDPSTATIPFIFLTGQGEDHRRRGMELGADDFLNKPFRGETLLAAVDSRLKRQQAITQQAEKKLSELRENITFALPHEIRTPLQGLLGFAELLIHDSESFQPQDIREIGGHIEKSAKSLHHTLENILMLAQIEILASDEGRLRQLRDARTEGVGRIVRNLSEGKAEQAGRKEDLKIEIASNDLAFPVSEENLRKIVEELLDNALKFSQKGTPIRVMVEESAEKVSFHIRDSGRGMSVEEVSKIGSYMQFNRRMYEQQGSGIGLALSKKLAELHGGVLSLQTEPGQGTTVTVQFPRRNA